MKDRHELAWALRKALAWTQQVAVLLNEATPEERGAVVKRVNALRLATGDCQVSDADVQAYRDAMSADDEEEEAGDSTDDA